MFDKLESRNIIPDAGDDVPVLLDSKRLAQQGQGVQVNSYRKQVRELASQRDGTPVYNSSIQHAAVLAEAMFEHAQKEVCVYSAKFNASVYGTTEVVERAKIFLADPATRVRVIVEQRDAVDLKDHPFLSEFLCRKDFEIRAVPTTISDKIAYHFMVMDDDCYRFERNKNEPSAIAAFGDLKGGKHLRGVFDNLWEFSDALTSQ